MDGDIHRLDNSPAVPTPADVGLCVVCTARGSCRFGFTSETLVDDRRVRYELTCEPHHQGGAGRAHGGWTASVLDEGLGRLPCLLGHDVVTATLTVDFLQPVPITTPLELTARVVAHDGRKWRIEGELRVQQDGTCLARARGLWIETGQ